MPKGTNTQTEADALISLLMDADAQEVTTLKKGGGPKESKWRMVVEHFIAQGQPYMKFSNLDDNSDPTFSAATAGLSTVLRNNRDAAEAGTAELYPVITKSNKSRREVFLVNTDLAPEAETEEAEAEAEAEPVEA
jgi:hypothetical protein